MYVSYYIYYSKNNKSWIKDTDNIIMSMYSLNKKLKKEKRGFQVIHDKQITMLKITIAVFDKRWLPETTNCNMYNKNLEIIIGTIIPAAMHL